jgi:hypothetical protein
MPEPWTRAAARRLLRLSGGGRGDHLLDLEQRLVWIMGSPRTGSTWLLSLLGRHPGIVAIDEPLIGAHLNPSSDVVTRSPDEQLFVGIHDREHARSDYFFADEYANVWRPILRRLVLIRMQSQVGRVQRRNTKRGTTEAPLVLIKEPNGSHGAEQIFELLPASRLLVLLRDPRDVLDSVLDAAAAVTWRAEAPRTAKDLSPEQRRRVLYDAARAWLAMTEAVMRTHDRLPDRQRIVVRYEDMRRDTAAQLRRIVDWLGVEMSDERIAQRVSALDFAKIPAEQKGPGRFARAAKPGFWRESLTDDEQGAIATWLGARLSSLGYS